MVEMVHDRIAAGETTVVSTTAVLRCGKQMEKLPHYNFSWAVSLQNWTWFGRGYGPVARQTKRRRIYLIARSGTMKLPTIRV
jgi:hypothetical protein